MIRHLDHFVCKQFAMFFSLWRDGGPDFLKEKPKWDLEQEALWTHVPFRSNLSYASVAAMPPTNQSRHKSVFKRIFYPSS